MRESVAVQSMLCWVYRGRSQSIGHTIDPDLPRGAHQPSLCATTWEDRSRGMVNEQFTAE